MTALTTDYREEFANWIDTLVIEKVFNQGHTFEAMGSSGVNYIPLDALIETIKSAPVTELKGIKKMIVRLDFVNANIMDYFAHLCQAIAI